MAMSCRDELHLGAAIDSSEAGYRPIDLCITRDWVASIMHAIMLIADGRSRRRRSAMMMLDFIGEPPRFRYGAIAAARLLGDI